MVFKFYSFYNSIVLFRCLFFKGCFRCFLVGDFIGLQNFAFWCKKASWGALQGLFCMVSVVAYIILLLFGSFIGDFSVLTASVRHALKIFKVFCLLIFLLRKTETTLTSLLGKLRDCVHVLVLHKQILLGNREITFLVFLFRQEVIIL